MGIEVTDERLFNAERDQLRARVAELEAALKAAESARDEWLSDFRQLEKAVVGETGLSAMTVALQAKLWRPRAETAEAERDRLQSEQDQLLADSAIRSDQRKKYEKLCNEMATFPCLTQQEAIDAIKALCRDNERLALGASKARRFRDISRRETVEHFERAEKLRAALQAHHEWHLAQDRDGGAWGIDPVDAYSESGLCEQTLAALEAKK